MSAKITEAMVKRATQEFLSHRGERPERIKRGGYALWEENAPAMRAALAAALSTEPGEAEGWRDMSSAPKDGTVVNVVGRYPDATAGFPRYAAFLEEDGDWFELSRNKPERIVPWAWRPRDAWPQEPAATPLLDEDTHHGR